MTRDATREFVRSVPASDSPRALLLPDPGAAAVLYLLAQSGFFRVEPLDVGSQPRSGSTNPEKGPDLDSMASFILLLCAGFLLAVLWMDLMFDVQVLGHGDEALPDEVLDSIASYYRRVTTRARPMGHVVGGMMLLGILTLLFQTIRGAPPRWLGLVSLVLFGAPAALALLQVYPSAVRLGSRVDSAPEQSRLARTILRGHLLCLGAMLGFVLLRLFAASP